MQKKYFSVIGILFFSIFSIAQHPDAESILKPLNWRNIGPANQGGRVTDIESLDNDYRKVWVATGSGGIWYSENAGTTFTPIFENYSTASIGDIAVFQPDPKIIWVGTGEPNGRNSVSWGNGVYKSEDGGKTFNNVGLKNTHHIGRIILHPTNKEIAYVAALGHLWGANEERGLYMTKDGGKNWTLLKNGLPATGKEGCTDIVIHPTNPSILFAAFYYRLRAGHHFHGGSDAGGIFKSTDGGASWKKLAKGLPADSTGRIGLAISRSNPDIVMAIVEAKRSASLSVPGSGVYRSEDGGESWNYVNTYNNRPFYYSQIRIHPTIPQNVYVLATPFMVSTDAGKTFANGSEDQEIHGDYHALWHDPSDAKRYYIGNDKGAFVTHDGGNKFIFLDNLPIAQYYRIAYDMNTPYRIYGGLQDNGFYSVESFSRDARGILNDANWKVHWGDGMYSAVNPNNHKEVYTSAENGSIRKLNPATHELKGVEPNVFNIVNAASFMQKGSGQPFLRFNWSAPFLLSTHDNKTLYMGSQYVMKSADAGKSWTIISPDLSHADSSKIKAGLSGGLTPDNTGAETHGTIYALSQSPLDAKMIWAGTDDGRLHLTLDEGKTWKDVNTRWPAAMKGLWIDRVVASAHKKQRAYVSVDGHRSDVFAPFIMVSEDAGTTWQSISSNIPSTEVIRSLLEDPVNENLLFAGTETGIWFSMNRGNTWSRLNKNLPTVSVYDLKIHPREKDLIAGTHGRSLWVLDDIGYLQQFTQTVQKSNAWLFDHKPVVLWENTSRGGQRGHFLFAGENPQGIKTTATKPRGTFTQSALITFYIAEANAGNVQISILDAARGVKRTMDTTVTAGIHRIEWDLFFESPLLTDKQVDDLESAVGAIPGTQRNVLNNIKRLKEIKNSFVQRSMLERIAETNPGIPVPKNYLPVKAGPGTYTLELQSGNVSLKKTLLLKADPLTKN